MDARGDAQDEDSAPNKDSDEYAAAESEDEIVYQTVLQSSIKIRTRSKSRKVNIPEALMCSLRMNYLARSSAWHRVRIHASQAPLRASGYARYFRRNSN
jgi:hypothetical protein